MSAHSQKFPPDPTGGANLAPEAHSGIVIVCGSINMDTFVSVPHFPLPGETLITQNSTQGLGGKGANQAVAAAHSGATTLFCGSIGPEEEPSAQWLSSAVHHYGVQTDYLHNNPLPSGQAFITTDPSGQNCIIVTSGANTSVAPQDYIPLLSEYCEQENTSRPVVLAQGELTPEHTSQFPQLVTALDARFVLNLAPVTSTDTAVLTHADPLILNELEAQEVLHQVAPTDAAPITDELSIVDAQKIAHALQPFAHSIIITLGAQGAVLTYTGLTDADSAVHIPAPTVNNVVDTTGAGDALAGTVAAALAQGASLEEALIRGLAAGSLATTALGASQSYPSRTSIDQLIANRKENTPWLLK